MYTITTSDRGGVKVIWDRHQGDPDWSAEVKNMLGEFVDRLNDGMSDGAANVIYRMLLVDYAGYVNVDLCIADIKSGGPRAGIMRLFRWVGDPVREPIPQRYVIGWDYAIAWGVAGAICGFTLGCLLGCLVQVAFR